MGPVEVVVVDNKKVSCDGSSSQSNHPLIYLNMGEKDNVVCPYCSKYFTTKKQEHRAFGAERRALKKS
jgi:uncharacterized Zn-finger protein